MRSSPPLLSSPTPSQTRPVASATPEDSSRNSDRSQSTSRGATPLARNSQLPLENTPSDIPDASAHSTSAPIRPPRNRRERGNGPSRLRELSPFSSSPISRSIGPKSVHNFCNANMTYLVIATARLAEKSILRDVPLLSAFESEKVLNTPPGDLFPCSKTNTKSNHAVDC